MQIQKLVGRILSRQEDRVKNFIFGVDAVTHNAVSKGFGVVCKYFYSVTFYLILKQIGQDFLFQSQN